MGTEEVAEQASGIYGKINLGHVAGLVELLVDQGHRAHPVGHILLDGSKGIIPQFAGLQGDQAGNNLRVVLHTVMDLFQEHLLFGERGLQRLFCVLDRRKIYRGGYADNLPGLIVDWLSAAVEEYAPARPVEPHLLAILPVSCRRGSSGFRTSYQSIHDGLRLSA
jgi:hypothetical protein